MPKNKSDTQISQREKDILNILWSTGKPLVASDIAKYGKLSINTVQSALKSLRQEQLVEVAEIVYSGTSLSRSYRPTMSKDEFITKDVSRYFKEVNQQISTVGIISALLGQEAEEEKVLEELEEMIKERKDVLKRESQRE